MTDERDDSPAFEARVTTAELKIVAHGIHAQLNDSDTDVEVHIKVFAPEDRRGRVAKYLSTLQQRFTSAESEPRPAKKQYGYRRTETLPDIAKYGDESSNKPSSV